MPSLFSERNTVFQRTIWDRYAYVSFLRRFKDMENEDFNQRNAFNYSFLQDGYYALMDLPLIAQGQNPTVQFWQTIKHTNWFRSLARLYRQDAAGQYVATDTLSKVARHYVTSAKQAQPKLPKELQEILEQLQANQPQESNDETQEDSQSAEAGAQPQESAGDPQCQPDARGDGSPSANETPAQNQAQGGQGQGSAEQATPASGLTYGFFKGIDGANDGSDASLSKFAEQVTDKAEDKYQGISSLLPYVAGDGEAKLLKSAAVISTLDASQLAKFLGFAMRAVTGAHHVADATSGELTRYKNTVWHERLHPVDLAGVARGDLRTKARMAEGGLRQRVYEDNTPRGRGPVVLIRDESQSMEGKPHNAARSLEIALAAAFNADHRDLVSFAFSTGKPRKCVYGIDDVTGHLTQFMCGGTVLAPALREAVATAKEYRDGADILIITDGAIMDSRQDTITDAIQELHDENGRVWVVMIGDYDVPEWADGSINLKDIEDSDKLAELIRTMNRKEIQTKGKKVAV